MNISENFDRWMFDYVEGNLSAAEQEAFENFLIQHPEFEIDADAWDNAVVPNDPVIYPNQSALEKERNMGAIYGWSAAAALILLLGVSGLFFLNDTQNNITGLSAFDQKIDQQNRNVYAPEHAHIRQQLIDQMMLEGESGNDLTVADQGSSWTASSQQLTSIQHQSSNSQAGNNNQSNGNDQDGTTVLAYNHVNVSALDQETGKYTSGDHIGRYTGNPEQGSLNFDVNHKKSTFKYRSFGRTVKNIYKKIERSLNSPLGITNLGDHDLGVPQNNILALNPGFAGGMLTPRFETTYRNQWLGSGMNVNKATMSFDFYSKEMRGGIGVMVSANDYGLGAYGDYQASLLYSPKFVINRKIVLEPAVKLTLGAMNANGNTLVPDSQIEMNRGRVINTPAAAQMTGTNQLWYKDYGLGLMLNTEWFYAGFSADNLANHYENVYGHDLAEPTRTPVLLTGVAGFDYESHDSRNSKKINRSISPYVVYQQFGTNPEFWAGTNLRYDWLTAGASYSTKNEFTASIGLHFERFRMIYRYDMTNSLVLDDKVGSHNIGIRINAKRKNSRPH